MQAVLDYAPAMKEGIKEASIAKNESGNMVEFRQVTFQYHENAAPALQNISFQIKTGEMVGIIGATGSGKSSLVHLLLRFYDVKKGEIWMDGKNITAYSLRTLRDKIALCPQKDVTGDGQIDYLICVNIEMVGIIKGVGVGIGEVNRVPGIHVAYLDPI